MPAAVRRTWTGNCGRTQRADPISNSLQISAFVSSSSLDNSPKPPSVDLNSYDFLPLPGRSRFAYALSHIILFCETRRRRRPVSVRSVLDESTQLFDA